MQKRLTVAIGVASVRGTFADSQYSFSKPNAWELLDAGEITRRWRRAAARALGAEDESSMAALRGA